VYVSERGVPLFRRGYERQSGVRECFRVPAADLWSAQLGDAAWWPATEVGGTRTDGTESRRVFRRAARPLRCLADHVLGAFCASSVVDGARRTGRTDDDDDCSLVFSFAYERKNEQPAPNDHRTSAAPVLVAEHVDQSLVVVAPVATAPGLQVFDRAVGSWITVEAACGAAPGTALIVFGGAALEHAAGVAACRHRVVDLLGPTNPSSAHHQPRLSLIFELKYASFYTHLRHFGD